MIRTSELRNLASYWTRYSYARNWGIIETLRPNWKSILTGVFATFLLLIMALSTASAEECKLASDMDAGTRSALDNTAQNLYQMAAGGNANGMAQASIPGIAANVAAIQAALNDHKADFGTSATVRNTYELDAPGNGPIANAEFFCGIFNSPQRVSFEVPNLPAGRYGLVIMDAHDGKEPMWVSFMLMQSGAQWQMAGFYPRPGSLLGHDGGWYLNQARTYKSKGELFNAWFYYSTGWDLSSPVPFMSTSGLDKLSQEVQDARPKDLPTPDSPMKLAAGGKVESLTEMFAVPVTDGLALVVKYQSPDISNAGQTYQDNVALISALVGKYPQFREAFTSIVARAVAPSGQDYGTQLAMKDVK